MPGIRFSLASSLAFVLFAGIAISILGGLEAESSLRAVWLGALLLAYWVSPKVGWPQVFRATVACAVAWTLSVSWTYTGFLCQDRGIAVSKVTSHGALIALAGTIVAFIAAGLVETGRTLLHSWPRLRWRIALTLCLPLFIVGMAVNRIIDRSGDWRPVAIIPVGDTRLRDVLLGLMGSLQGLRVHSDTVMVPADVPIHSVATADSRYVAAILNGQRQVRVYDAHTNEVITTIEASHDDQGEWFGDLTFLRNGELLVLRYSQRAPPTLLHLEIPSGLIREPISLDSLLRASEFDERVSFSLDHCLLVVYSRAVDKEQSRVRIGMVPVLDEPLALRWFLTGTIHLPQPKARGVWHVDPGFWMISDDFGEVTVCPRGKGLPQSYLFRSNGTTKLLRGRALGFVPNSKLLFLKEDSASVVWRQPRNSVSGPPFWHNLRAVPCWRLTAFDCERLESSSRSSWLTDVQSPHMSLDRSRVWAQQDRSIWIWTAQP